MHTLSITEIIIYILCFVWLKQTIYFVRRTLFPSAAYFAQDSAGNNYQGLLFVATLLHGGSMTCCWFSGSLHPCWTPGSLAPHSHCWLDHSLLAPLLPSSLIQFWFLLAPWPPNHGSLLAPWLHADCLYPCGLLTGSLATGWLLGSLLAHC